MALADIWALSKESNNSGNFKIGIALDRTNKKNYASSRMTDMEFESKKPKHRSSFALTAKVHSSAAPFMPSWSKLANMNVARYDFACAEVNGMIYAAGGYGMDGESLSCAEVYTPEFNRWTVIESLRRPRWGCFACEFEEKLYVMGGRSSFTIGNSRFVDVYNPETHTWCKIKNGCVMVTAYAVLDKKLFCMEWKNQRKLAIFNPEDNSWKMVPVPVTGSSSIGFRFGILDGKLLFFTLEEEPGYTTLLYDPNSAPGSEWQASEIKLSGSCLCIVTMKA